MRGKCFRHRSATAEHCHQDSLKRVLIHGLRTHRSAELQDFRPLPINSRDESKRLRVSSTTHRPANSVVFSRPPARHRSRRGLHRLATRHRPRQYARSRHRNALAAAYADEQFGIDGGRNGFAILADDDAVVAVLHLVEHLTQVLAEVHGADFRDHYAPLTILIDMVIMIKGRPGVYPVNASVSLSARLDPPWTSPHGLWPNCAISLGPGSSSNHAQRESYLCMDPLFGFSWKSSK